MSTFKLVGHITTQKLSGKLKLSAVGREPSYQDKVVTPMAEEQVIKCDDGYDALKSVTIAGDENFKAENIKNGKTIWGVDGTAVGSPFITSTTWEWPTIYKSSVKTVLLLNFESTVTGTLYQET